MRPKAPLIVGGRRSAVLWALTRRDFLIARSYKSTFTLDVFFGVMNLVIFYFISRTVTLRSGPLEGAPTYFAFASVGIILTVVMQSATTGLARRVREEQLTGTLEMLVVQPISSGEMAAGLTGFPFLFGVLRAAFYLAVAGIGLGLSFGRTDLAGLALVLLATALALSGIGVLLGGLVLVIKQGEALATVVTFAFGLLSGALFPRTLLPGWLQGIGAVLPTRFALDGMRRALFEGGGWAPDLLGLLVTAALVLPVSVAFFSWTIQVVKKSGSLSQY